MAIINPDQAIVGYASRSLVGHDHPDLYQIGDVDQHGFPVEFGVSTQAHDGWIGFVMLVGTISQRQQDQLGR